MRQGIITGIHEETSDVRGFSVKLQEPFQFMPGQYVMLAFPDSQDTKRAFSVVTYDKDKNEIFLLIKKVGSFTARLFQIGKGAEIAVFGPYGRFCLPKEEKSLVFVAGGIGVTPLYSMLLHVHNSDYGANVHLFYSAKKIDEMVLLDRFKEIKNERIRMNFFLTQENAEGFRNERIDSSIIKNTVPEFDSSLFYICGPKAMIENMKSQLRDSSISDAVIKSEEFQ